jgi:phosphoglucosamine mutase
MTRTLFGTDGIRGLANAHPMTAETMLKVAMAAGSRFKNGGHRHRVIIGKDTRLSGYMLEPALTAGFISVGMDVLLLGPMPTPAVGMLTRSMRCDLGVMISASHNPYQDNGIKLFGPDGFKLSDAVEAEIEAMISEGDGKLLAVPSALGRARRLEDAAGRYIEFVKATFPNDRTLDGLKVVIDCANGAAYAIAPTVLAELGATVVPIAVDPNGFNINDGCGATAPQALCEAVVRHQADIGLALDGDADRLIVVDENGRVIDGDQIMGLIASTWARDGRIRAGGIVATIMSNLGLERHLKGLGLELRRTAVGDRYVLEEMRASGFNLGGEQSGHMIMTDFATTGDGLMAGLQVLAALVEAGRPASELLDVFPAVPQRLHNVRYAGGQPLDSPHVQAAIAEARARLGEDGRVVIRKSGTEPVIRVMAEGEDEGLVQAVVMEIAAAVEAAGHAAAAAE